jgi:hypothetical protein
MVNGNRVFYNADNIGISGRVYYAKTALAQQHFILTALVLRLLLVLTFIRTTLQEFL